ncbi:hypothetical protein [Thioalkalivibrio sp. ALJ1]|uniref:hypothetical protein n=1 Tax=Thioalkalivibrio sp. ALJ1 TaxID=1158144 RepID=UPI0005705046|nr:hypothetical protein [Thioalkalivibrio sp. ALJ1]
MERANRKVKIVELAHSHPALEEAEMSIGGRHLLALDALTPDGVRALLETTPIPVTRMSDHTIVTLGERRLLQAAQMYFEPQDRITVVEYRGSNSEDVWAAIWARQLHTLYSAPAPDGYIRQMDAIRGAMPTAAIEKWCPSIRSARQFAEVTGISRNTLRRPRNRSGTGTSSTDSPLNRIRKGVHGGE